MSMLNRAPRPAQLPHASEFHGQTVDAALTREERRRVALASLTIMEHRFRLKLAQIAAEKRALLSTDYRQKVGSVICATRESEDHVALLIFFPVGQLTPRGVRRRFIDSLRIAIAKARVAREMDNEICEELWRALPTSDRA